ncbi:hypothetical protein BC829DRAFT_268986 [Chytridium lagenaria]|nr:hypothetical protein BC829DRAFT_268986 [Chytridium lagenaria]
MDVAIPKIPDSRNGTLVLVTGGAGFVGSNLVDRLLSLGYRVRILDNLTSGSIRNVPIEDDRVDLIVGDVSNLQTVQTAIKGVEIVFHLAAQRRGAVSDPHEIRKLIESHTQGIWNVMETAKLNGVSRVIYTSTFLSHGRHSGDAHIVSESGSEYLIKSLHPCQYSYIC